VVRFFEDCALEGCLVLEVDLRDAQGGGTQRRVRGLWIMYGGFAGAVGTGASHALKFDECSD
jgi:hypothetical protein